MSPNVHYRTNWAGKRFYREIGHFESSGPGDWVSQLQLKNFIQGSNQGNWTRYAKTAIPFFTCSGLRSNVFRSSEGGKKLVAIPLVLEAALQGGRARVGASISTLPEQKKGRGRLRRHVY